MRELIRYAHAQGLGIEHDGNTQRLRFYRAAAADPALNKVSDLAEARLRRARL